MPGNSEKLEPKKSGELLTPRSRKRDREGDRPRDPGGIEESGTDYHLSSKRHRRDRGRDRGRERDKDRGRRKSRSLSGGERDKRRERSSRERRRPSRRGRGHYLSKPDLLGFFLLCGLYALPSPSAVQYYLRGIALLSVSGRKLP